VKASRGFKALVVVLAALTLSTGLASAASNGAASSNAPSPQLLEALKAQARGTVTVSAEGSTTYLGFIRVDNGGDLLPGGATGSPEAKVQDFMAQYGALLGLADSAGSLVPAGTETDEQGATHLTYSQVYQGVPVFGGTIRAHVDADGSLTGINGTVVPDLTLTTTPKLSEAKAGELAIAHVIADPPRDEHGNPPEFLTAADLKASATLFVYRVGLVRGVPGTSQLVYEVEVTNGENVRDFVFVHAHVGKVVNRYSGIGGALFRRLFEQNTSNQVWQEGDPFPGTLNIDQENIVRFSGHSYYHFFNAFGRDSYDALGHEMQSVNNDPTIACPNANWNGATTNYCNGVTSDDVVAHEWGHAYTQFTHNLIYQWQPGALNESYSDIWGETVDLINGFGTDAPGGLRTVGSCSTHTTPPPVLVINTPTPGQCPAGGATFGPPLTIAGVTGDLVLGLDPADAAGPSTTDACSPLTNAAAVNSNIALVDRGTCAFTVKVKNAQDAGARGVVVANTLGRGPFGMVGADPTIVIPSLGISNAHGDLLKGYLASGPSNVTLKLAGSTATPEDSYRWLMGEDATAFGGAIRDMWTPTCLGDPGKVTDAEYHCDASDGGGVHSNSGVPNHGFALLVDGTRGVTYNGQNIDAIGLIKAAHLYWRAQSVYQTQTSDFTDHADALEASCTDLIGVSLEGLSTSETPAGPSGESFTTADCAAVHAMTLAVELRTDPNQCNFQPLLSPNAPRLCPDGQTPERLYRERFEQGGLRGWTLSNQGVFAGWPGLNWQHAQSLPGGRNGRAAFAANPDAGNCDGGAGDISGVMRLESPVIRLRPPSTRTQSMRLRFDHYVATEAGWDGGNISISVNGGPYQLIPATAFLFNAYNTTINPPEAGNTNPLAGQPGWSGTDGGQVFGSWGESQVDLTALGVQRGDRIRLRFDFGMDGCTGVDGWYVDDVTITACRSKRPGDNADGDNADTTTASARRT
jgi:trimeric autotransporter adhesin